MDKALKESRKLRKWLNARDWFVSERDSPVEKAQIRIESIRRDAIEREIRELNLWLYEASFWADGTQTSMKGDIIPTTKRDRKKAQTDALRINRTIDKLREMIQ